MRRRCVPQRPAVPVAGRAATGVLVLWRFVFHCATLCNIIEGKIRRRDTPPIHRRYRWWGRDAKGGGGWGAAEGPWTGGGTMVRTPDDDEWQSMVHTTKGGGGDC